MVTSALVHAAWSGLLVSPASANGARRVAILFLVEITIAAGAWIAFHFYAGSRQLRRPIFHRARIWAVRLSSWQKQYASFAALGRGVLRVATAVARLETDQLERWAGAITVTLPRALASAAAWSNASIADRAVQSVAGTIESLSMPARLLQNGRLRTYLVHIALGLIAILGYCLYRARH